MCSSDLSILGTAGMKATDREFGLVSEQVVKILARVSRLLNHDAIVFDESAALKRINEIQFTIYRREFQ